MAAGGISNPDLRAGDAAKGMRYPSPFFDISQQYVPPTLKEAMKWFYFYATNSSTLAPALKKISRYPITDLVIEDHNDDLVRKWQLILNNTLGIKTFNAEVNLDLIVYGNAFVTINYPFTRFLQCGSCGHKFPFKSVEKKIDNLTVKIKCSKCGMNGKADIIDIPFRSLENLRLVRINPEFIDIKYNDATGRHTYLYSIPDKLKRQIMSGDADIFEDTPKIYLDAIRQRKKIRLSYQNLYHLKLPTLAGKDMGWGMSSLLSCLKDLYYFSVLRRGQEAIMLEHITPFDIIYPQSNGKFDPYVHSDLSNWKREWERQLANRRRDPNYKAIVPFPVGYERISGDGKNMLLTPEQDFLVKVICGTAGVPQEFVYGGNLQWSGSSVALRTLENEFIHHRSMLLQCDIWVMERVRVFLGYATPKSVKFADFKMADDMQKLQMMIGLAGQGKLDWEDIYKELGKDPVVVRERIMQEALFDAKLQEQQAMVQAEAQAKAQMVQQRIVNNEQKESQADQLAAQAAQAQEDHVQQAANAARLQTMEAIARKLADQPPEEQQRALERLANMDEQFAQGVSEMLAKRATTPHVNQEKKPHAPVKKPGAQAAGRGSKPIARPALQPVRPSGNPAQRPQAKPLLKHPVRSGHPALKAKQPGKPQAKPAVNMRPLPVQKPPRRAGGI